MLRRRRLPHVLLLIETSRAYGRGLVEGVGRYVKEHGPWSIYYEERGLNDPLPRWLKDWRGDGIITRTASKANLTRLQATGLPIVELGADPALGLPSVFPNHDRVSRMAADHFLDRGLRHLAFYCTDGLWWMDKRREAFARALAERGLGCEVFGRPRRGRECKRPQSLERETLAWLRQLPKPCGVFCASDLYASRLTHACRNGGIAVPEQVAVLGVDNDPVMCGMSFPPLSSIDPASQQIGYQAAALLDQLMAGKKPPTFAVQVDPLAAITRQSTDVLAIPDPNVAQAVRLIREHACRGLRVAQVAEAVGLSRRLFEQRFQRTLQRTAKQEILDVQIERARMLLRETDLLTAAVARKTGFASLEYFSRAFHRETGLPPREYRRKSRFAGPSAS